MTGEDGNASSRIAAAQASGSDELDLSELQLSDLPPQLYDLKQLRSLTLASNDLEVLPAELFGLSRLERLDIRDNLIRELPAQLGQLKRLTDLKATGNRIARIDPDALNLPRLEQLHLNKNDLSELPSISRLSALELLDLDENRLSALPDGIEECKRLETLYAAENRITDVPETLLALNLSTLWLAENPLSLDQALIDQLTDQIEDLELDRVQAPSPTDVMSAIPETMSALLSALGAGTAPETPGQRIEATGQQADGTELEERFFETVEAAQQLAGTGDLAGSAAIWTQAEELVKSGLQNGLIDQSDEYLSWWAAAEGAIATGLSLRASRPAEARDAFARAADRYELLSQHDDDPMWPQRALYARAYVTVAQGQLSLQRLDPGAARAQFQLASRQLEKLAEQMPDEQRALVEAESLSARAMFALATYRHFANRSDWHQALEAARSWLEMLTKTIDLVPDDTPSWITARVSVERELSAVSVDLAEAEMHRENQNWTAAFESLDSARRRLLDASELAIETGIEAEAMQQTLLNMSTQIDGMVHSFERERDLQADLTRMKEELEGFRARVLESLGGSSASLSSGPNVNVQIQNQLEQQVSMSVQIEEGARRILDELRSSLEAAPLPEDVRAEALRNVQSTAEASRTGGSQFVDRLKRLSGYLGTLLTTATTGLGDITKLADQVHTLANLFG